MHQMSNGLLNENSGIVDGHVIGIGKVKKQTRRRKRLLVRGIGERKQCMEVGFVAEVGTGINGERGRKRKRCGGPTTRVHPTSPVTFPIDESVLDLPTEVVRNSHGQPVLCDAFKPWQLTLITQPQVKDGVPPFTSVEPRRCFFGPVQVNGENVGLAHPFFLLFRPRVLDHHRTLKLVNNRSTDVVLVVSKGLKSRDKNPRRGSHGSLRGTKFFIHAPFNERHLDKEAHPAWFMEDELVVQFAADSAPQKSGFIGTRMVREIWREITFGVGMWGALRPLIAAILAAVPFLFLGQHFNRQHQRGIDWFLLQIPLALTIVLWLFLYLWSIFDAWRDAVESMGQGQS